MRKKKEIKKIEEPEECTCRKESIEKHLCPFAQDVHNDSETLCSCCDYCTYQCAMDI